MEPCHDCAPRCARCYQREWRAKHRTPAPPRRCAVCDNSFTPKRNDARFCRSACRQEYYRVSNIKIEYRDEQGRMRVMSYKEYRASIVTGKQKTSGESAGPFS
jgi:hypothetical protein